MHEASFTSVIRTILIIALFYYGFKILFRIFFPFLVTYLLKKTGSAFEQQFKNQQQQKQSYTTQKEEPKVSQKPKVGEYIDYEEIE